jgi:hypothetical protein
MLAASEWFSQCNSSNWRKPMLRAILNAIMMALMSPWYAIVWGAGAIDRLFGGGAGAMPAPPIANLAGALPDVERIDQAKDLEFGKARASDAITKRSPAMQAKIYAGMTEEQRESADLTLLSPEQVFWLVNLEDKQLATFEGFSDRRIEAALKGEPDALTAILSVSQKDPMKETVFAARLAAARDMKLPEAAYAIH